MTRLPFDIESNTVPVGNKLLAAGFFRPLQSHRTGLRATHRKQRVRFVLNFETQPDD